VRALHDAYRVIIRLARLTQAGTVGVRLLDPAQRAEE